MRIDENTKKCISISEKPGTFGLKFHNKGYELLGLNQIYLPLKVISSQLEPMVELVKENFHGCSVSMPHKTQIIKYLDELDESSEKTGAVNTVLNIEGKLKGYNTDYYGAKKALQENLNIRNREILMVGAGGVARAIGHAILDLGGKLTITNRTNEEAKDFANKIDANYLPFENKESFSGYLLINATKVGFEDPEKMIVQESTISNFNVIMDVVVNSNTKLIRSAKDLGKEVISGTIMTIYQAEKQFEIYTGERLPEEFIKKTLEELA